MRSYLTHLLHFMALAAFFLVLTPFAATAGGRPHLINGIYFLTQPSDYKAFQDAIDSYKDSGANTVIIRPVSGDGTLDRLQLAKAVFFAHQAGMGIFVLVPTRSLTFLLKQHPDWEDVYYDVYTGAVKGTRKLDLFNPYVTVYLSDLFRDIAGYSVDGILLDQDFSYSETEGLSGPPMDQYRKKYASRFSPHQAFGNLKPVEQENHKTEEYGPGFWNLAELKKNKLLLVLKNLMLASRAVNKDVSFGITIHVPGLFITEKEQLAWYSHDLRSLKKMDINYFWLAIPHRDIRAQQEINYKKSIETVARIAISSLTLVNDPGKIILAVQAVSTSGKLLPLSEVEEVSAQSRRTGKSSIAFMIDSDTQLSPVLMKKIFRHQAE